MSDFTNLPKHFSAAQVAEYLGISERTVKREIRSGKLKSIKIRGRRRVTENQLRQYIEERERESCPENDSGHALGNSSSSPEVKAASSTSAGTTLSHDRQTGLALARQICGLPN